MINHKLQLQFLLVLLAGSLLLTFFIFSPFLAPLALAAVFAVVLQPLYRRLLQQLGGQEALASLATVLISVVCILVPLTLLSIKIFQEAQQLYGTLIQGESSSNIVGGFLQNTGRTLEQSFTGAEMFFTNLSADLDVYTKQGLEWLIGHLGAALSSAASLLLNLFIFFVALYYLLRDGPKLKRALVALSPLEDADDEMVFGRLTLGVNSVVRGSLAIALIQGVLAAIGFTLFDVPNSVLLGTLAAVAALIPGIGTALVIVPAVIYLFVVGSTMPAVGLLVWGVLAVGLIDNFLGPKLMGSGMQLHPLFVLLSVLGGIAFFGAIGIFLGPLTLSLLFAFITIYSYLLKAQ